eukprot:767188-Hanusia_phi.AAC.8
MSYPSDSESPHRPAAPGPGGPIPPSRTPRRGSARRAAGRDTPGCPRFNRLALTLARRSPAAALSLGARHFKWQCQTGD